MDFKDINRFMVIGAHCDDVDIRFGGTFSRLVREGRHGAYVVGVENAYIRKDHQLGDVHEALVLRRRESSRAAELLGAERLDWLEMSSFYLEGETPHERLYPDFSNRESLLAAIGKASFYGAPPVANASWFPRCVERLRDLIAEFAPDAIFTNPPDDQHPDHYALSCFVTRVIRLEREAGTKTEIFYCEPGSSGPTIGFTPNVYVELSSADVKKKQSLINLYDSQFPEGLTDNFAKERAQAWGRLSGLAYAEAFHRGCCSGAGAWAGESGFIQQLSTPRKEPEIYRLQSTLNPPPTPRNPATPLPDGGIFPQSGN